MVDSPPRSSPIDRFKETACSLGCDEDEAAFDEKLKGIAKIKPKVDLNLNKKPNRE